MLRVLILFIILNFYSPVFSSTKEKIVSKLQLTNNLSFNFVQTIGKKNENGKCIIKYPGKIWCKYNSSNKKIIVSNGKSLVIKTSNNGKGSYFRYPIKKTLLELLLNKEYLISKMKTLKPRKIDNKYLNFKIIENNNEINIFFDIKNLSLVGWQTEDIYQNLTVTFISSVKTNQKIDNKIFILPSSY
tara:strand:- start:91 stop:651 length:561 start_codon:yes stop_codon:yes gene_type:complete